MAKVSVQKRNATGGLELKPASPTSKNFDNITLNFLMILQKLNVRNWLAAEGFVM
jgi:hypothetical protein